jgi:hypothetical protein
MRKRKRRCGGTWNFMHHWPTRKTRPYGLVEDWEYLKGLVRTEVIEN